jgi:anti-sigma regulatory factor (Ser/Thr protein kinase)
VTHVEAAFPCEPASARRARDVVAHALRDWGLDHRVDDAQLVTTELVTNAVLHAATPLGLLVSHDEGELTVEVRDGLPIDFGLPDPVAAVDDDLSVVSMSGRGLVLVASCVDSWGIDVDDVGKTVWTSMRTSPNGRVRRADPSVQHPGDDRTTGLTLLDVPTAVVLANVANLDDRVRELSLLDSERAPSELVELARAFTNASRATATERLRGRRAARAAAARRDERFTVFVPGDRDALTRLHRLTAALRALDELAGAGQLLVPPASAEIVRFREWVLSEAASQLDGNAPRAYPAAR